MPCMAFLRPQEAEAKASASHVGTEIDVTVKVDAKVLGECRWCPVGSAR